MGVASDEVRRFGLNPAKRARLIRAGADLVVPDFSQHGELLALLGVPGGARERPTPRAGPAGPASACGSGRSPSRKSRVVFPRDAVSPDADPRPLPPAGEALLDEAASRIRAARAGAGR